jgi:hypothetical protein
MRRIGVEIMTIEEVLRSARFEDISYVVSTTEFSPTELNQVLEYAIDARDWPMVGRCVSAIQSVPSTTYNSALCRLLREHRMDFHPEEVVDAIGEIIELEESAGSYLVLIDCLAPLVLEVRNGDPAQHINRKCIDNIDFIARQRGEASRKAIELLKKAAVGNAEFAAEVAQESLDLLRREGFLK